MQAVLQATPTKVHAHTHLLHVDLNVLLEVVLVQVDDEVAHKVEAVAHNDEGKLIRQLGLFHEILDNLYRIIKE